MAGAHCVNEVVPAPEILILECGETEDPLQPEKKTNPKIEIRNKQRLRKWKGKNSKRFDLEDSGSSEAREPVMSCTLWDFEFVICVGFRIFLDAGVKPAPQ